MIFPPNLSVNIPIGNLKIDPERIGSPNSQPISTLFHLNVPVSTRNVTKTPFIIQLHIILAFVIFLIIPFTRLVHVLVFPLSYLWRPYQKVIWYWDRKQIRNPDAKWTIHKPKNN